MKEVCLITYDKILIHNETDQSSLPSSSSLNPYLYDVTEPLLLNIKLLFNTSDGLSIDLNLLRIVLCFHLEICSILFLLIFIFQHVWKLIQKWHLGRFGAIVKNKNSDKKTLDLEKQPQSSHCKNSFQLKTDSSEFLFTPDPETKFKNTACFKIKKIVAAILVLVYLIELSIILLLYEYDVFGQAFQYFFSNILNFAATICVLYYMFAGSHDCKHQIYVSLYWLLLLCNFLLNIASQFVLIADDGSGGHGNQDGLITLWKICSLCYWKSASTNSSIDSDGRFSYWDFPMTLESNFRQIITFNEQDETNLLNRTSLVWFHFNCFYFLLFLSQFVLSFFPDLKLDSFGANTDTEKQKFNPETLATLFGRTFQVWISSTIYLGYRRPLTTLDIFKTNLSVERSEKYFSNKFYTNQFNPSSKHGWFLAKHRTSVRLVKILLRQFGWEFVTISFIKLFPTLMTFFGPLLLDCLIKFATSVNYDQPKWHGYVYVFAMFAVFLNESILNSYSDYRLMVLALKIRASLTAAIYRCLLINENQKRKYTSGPIVNIMSTDTQRVFEYIKIVNLFWICPLQITVATFFLWQHLGYGSLAGLAVLLLLLPLNTFIGARIRLLQSKLLKHKDCRMKFLNETLAGIRALKLYAWEEFFQDRIERSRRMEISNLRIQALFSAAITFAFTSAPFFVAFASFSLFIYINSDSVHLDANKAFVSLAIFNIIRRPLAFFPQLIANSMMFLVSLKRISDFLQPKLQSKRLRTLKNLYSNNRPQINIYDCDFRWSIEDEFILKDINLKLNEPKLLTVVGEIGSGKSSLLLAILGQMNIEPKTERSIYDVDGRIAYVPQNSWIQSGTIRENILFGKPMDPVRYWQIIDACALLDDFKHMDDGDKTMVGEKGFNLSGGQRQRISLARAIYSDADLFLLDDPLSALDSQVSKHIFNRCIGNKGLLSNKIRVLVTHNMALLPNVDQILLLENGRQLAQGSYLELIDKENQFTNYLTTYFSTTTSSTTKQTNNSGSPNDEDETDTDTNPETLLVDEEEDYEILVEMAERLERQFSSFSRRGSILRTISLSQNDKKHKEKKKQKKRKCDRKIPKEITDFSESTIRTGSVSYKIYLHYVQAIGILPLLLIFCCYILGHCFVVLNNLWLSSWSNDKISSEDVPTDKINSWINVMMVKIGLLKTTSQTIDQSTRLNVYAFLGLGQTVFILMATLLLNFACLRGSQALHKSMLARMMHAPIWFFDQATSGQILNRFSKDIDLADTTLISTLRLFMIEIFRSIALFGIIAIGTKSPIIFAFFIPLVIGYILIYKYYVSTSRQLMRLESMLRTPIYLQFNETYNGVAVIRAFNVMEMFLKKIYHNIDRNTSALHMNIAASRWLTVRLECLGNLVVLITALACVMLRGQITPGMVGLCITCSLAITGTLNLLIRSSIELETNIVAVERLIEYTRLPQEDEWYKLVSNHDPQTRILDKHKTKTSLSDCLRNFLRFKPRTMLGSDRMMVTDQNNNNLKNLSDISAKNEPQPSSWLHNGSISFHQYSARYQKSLNLCLKNINLFVSAGSKVGIVGRTGAGKSSLAMALFRLIEPEAGSIFISERNIKKVGLHELRCALTIIPQDPLMFTGTLRENLDPFQQYSDGLLLGSLAKTHLGDICCSVIGLNQPMDIFMDRLSFGQKQLFCLARALLKKSKILILDEATAGIDPATDLLVQETIRLEFSECTVLTIAHRIKTVLNYDQILVLDQGRVVEFDSPKTLISNTNSLFYKMISQ